MLAIYLHTNFNQEIGYIFLMLISQATRDHDFIYSIFKENSNKNLAMLRPKKI